MRVVMFYHSLVSDWNHGNAHFLRGVASELIARGHEVSIYEPRDGWSLQNLLAGYGDGPIRGFEAAYPRLRSTMYDNATLDLDRALDRAGLVLVHEWNDPALVARIGRHRARTGSYRLLFHDTHHRAVSSSREFEAYDLSSYDGVLAFGETLRELYVSRGWSDRVWTWHEAACARVFRPMPAAEPEGDLVWIGNWGDDERTAELEEFLIRPVKELGLRAAVYGVRYPDAARAALAAAGISYRGWVPNYAVPAVFGKFRLTVHIPRQPYVRALPGIPTIRVFEALACGIPLISAPWCDRERLFEIGRDFLMAASGTEMVGLMKHLLSDEAAARELATHGRRTLLARHTCTHRVDALLAIERLLASEAKEVKV
ncbi:MAG TPA: glycosyltransferase [Bryobacteraceae bacterium]|nr:glycosyltransferase [Bryobacteraceae bacterium]